MLEEIILERSGQMESTYSTNFFNRFPKRIEHIGPSRDAHYSGERADRILIERRIV